MARKHRWGSKGEKRTITVPYKPSEHILKYLTDMRDALTMALAHGYGLAKINGNVVPDRAVLRGKVKPSFAQYGYAMHHVNPLCTAAMALLKAYKKRKGGSGYLRPGSLP